jgi:MFS family permease
MANDIHAPLASHDAAKTPPAGNVRAERRRARGALATLLAAHALSQTGNMVTTVAVPLYVLGLGGSGVEVGIAAFFATAPIVLGGALGGVVVDRVGRRRAAIVSDVVSAVAVLAIPVIALFVGLPFWGLLVLVFTAGLLDTPGQIARRVMLPGLADRAGARLEQSVGLLDGSERLAKFIGSVVAGVLVALVGPTVALFVNAATFLVSAVLTWLFVPAGAEGSASGVGAEHGGEARGAHRTGAEKAERAPGVSTRGGRRSAPRTGQIWRRDCALLRATH